MYKDDTPDRGTYSFAIKWGIFFLIVTVLTVFLINFFFIASAPSRVLSKTLGTENIITSYEWFFDANAQYVARRGQVKSHAALIKDVTDSQERQRMTIELGSMRQSCRDLVTRYNANSAKANKSLFKSNNLPEALELSTCET